MGTQIFDSQIKDNIALTGAPTAPTPSVSDDSTRIATTEFIKNQVASDTVKGMVELATSAEVLVGTDTERAVTPATLTAKILGTVSEVDGVPTGAIIESGSNANGDYIKFANGTMMCSYTDQIGTSVNTTTSSWGPSISTYYANVIYTYPASFFSAPNVAIASIDSGSGVCSACLGAMPTTTSGHIELIGSCALAKISYIAIGRWY